MQTPRVLHRPTTPDSLAMTGVSFVIPVRNGAAWLRDTLDSIDAQRDGRPFEIIVVDDGSTDGSGALLQSLAERYRLTILNGPARGAAAAVNAGAQRASHPVVCQVDQDVVLEPGWMTTLVTALEDTTVAAAQGRYIADSNGSFFARVMGLDLEQRYIRLDRHPDHVCTGNTAYRADALRAVDGLDEALGYGYDNDLSYRLQAAGYRLAFCRDARSRHRWREGLVGYLTQQYGFGYGRLDVVAKHPTRLTGDAVSPTWMMGHPLVLGVALALFAAAAMPATSIADPSTLGAAGVALVLALAVERAVAGIRAWRASGNTAALAFPVVHLMRDLAWVAAILVWTARRISGRPLTPGHSMPPRPVN